MDLTELELQDEGIPACKNHIAQLLAKNGLRARNGKGYKYFPGPNARNHVSDNLLRRNFTANKPDEKWVSDITYIKLNRGNAYLAVIMDLYSRKIIGWALDTSMTNQLIIDAFQMAVKSRGVEPGLILHSDRGVQYRSGEYQHLLLSQGIRPSMSRKGNCWDTQWPNHFSTHSKLSLFIMFGFKRGWKRSTHYSTISKYILTYEGNIRRIDTRLLPSLNRNGGKRRNWLNRGSTLLLQDH